MEKNPSLGRVYGYFERKGIFAVISVQTVVLVTSEHQSRSFSDQF